MDDEQRSVEIIAPGEIGSRQPVDVAGWKLKIAGSWRSAAESILQVAKELVDARASLKRQSGDLWEELQKQLHDEQIISESIQKKLVVIGGKYLELKDFSASLPPRYNAIYQLTDLSKGQLEKLVKSNRLKPTLEDREIAKLLTFGKRKKEIEEDTSPNIPLFRVVQTRKRLSAEGKATLEKAIQQIREIAGLELKLSREGKDLLGEEEEDEA